jgi:hypothetical protein
MLRAYSTPAGLGAHVLVNDEGKPTWVGLFGFGLDGKDLVLSGSVNENGVATLIRRTGVPTGGWPVAVAPAGNVGAGHCAVSIEGDKLFVVYNLHRAAIGGDDLVFSPPPPRVLTGRVELNRLV